MSPAGYKRLGLILFYTALAYALYGYGDAVLAWIQETNSILTVTAVALS